MKIAVLILTVFCSLNAMAFEGVYLGPDKSTWPNTESRKTKNDFAAWLIATPDRDWKEKWNTPPDTVPHFSEVEKLKVGEQLVILTFFTNPKTDNEQQTKVICSLKVTRPDSSISADQKDFPCLFGKLNENPNYIRMSPAVIQFVGEETDPLGEYIVEVEVYDAMRETTLHLVKKFTLEAKQ